MTASQALQGRRMNVRQQLRFPAMTQNQDAVFQSIHCLPHLFAIGLSQVEHYDGHWQAHKLGCEQRAQPTAWSTLDECLHLAPNTPRPAPLTIHKPAAVRRDPRGADAQVQLGKVLHHLRPSGGGPTPVVARWCNRAGGAALPSCRVQVWHSLQSGSTRRFSSQKPRTTRLSQAFRTSPLQQQLGLLPERT